MKKHKEYIVTVEEPGNIEVVRCADFKTAVNMYRRLCDLYTPFSCKIYEEVVGYGEKI